MDLHIASRATEIGIGTIVERDSNIEDHKLQHTPTFLSEPSSSPRGSRPCTLNRVVAKITDADAISKPF